MLNVIAKVTAKTDQIEAVKAGLLTVIEPTRREEGCISYELHQDIKDKNIFFFYENWDSLHHLEEHRLKPHMVELGHQIKDLLEHHMEVNLMDKL
ncbi:MAG: antibiotic biosynthesis monooxygenase [Sphingobacteriaceae bacterium]|nr:MAG: antibiotic biosynthesis monooxygenase [Sphingobacteriaceae bacterium]